MDIYDKVIKVGKILIEKYLPKIIEGTAPRIVQNDFEVTIFKKRSLNQNEIDIENETIENIYRKIRALSKPYKGAYVKKNGKKLIIWKAELEKC